jgi:hypothetical protein
VYSQYVIIVVEAGSEKGVEMADESTRWADFAALVSEKKRLKAKLRQVNEWIAETQEPLLEYLAENGLRSIKTDDGRTTYIHRSVYVGAKDTDYTRACAAFEAEGLGEFVQQRFNVNTVSSWYREATADGGKIPDALESVLDVTERVTLRVKNS